MADAKVQFHRLGDDDDLAPAGAEQTFSFACPKHDRRGGNLVIAGKTTLPRDGQNHNGGVAQWDWDHNRLIPSLAPSVNCSRCWHGYIRGGRTVDCAGQDEPEIPRTRT